MHIPDGYLSPTTCATLYGAATPFWYISIQRAKRAMNTRMVPLLALFAAFCFVIMMFNLPLPGGTTGHATGIAIAAVVLGPWGAVIAISVALAIQAVFFGDGGITSLGANCFNMAIVGALVSYAVYRLAAWSSPTLSRRRALAAGMAGYVAINVMALLAAVELGVQPMLFHDATGAPLYAPYPLHIAIPAVMLGHLTIAGIAEFVLSFGVVSFVQRANPELLGGVQAIEAAAATEVTVPGRSTTRPFWAALAVLLLLTPLGVLAVGTAWGEWSPHDFGDAQARREITAGSGGHAPPLQVPKGLEKLSSIWTAPFPDYAPRIVRHPVLGYMLSGMFGSGLTIIAVVFGMRLVARPGKADPEP